MTTSAPQWPGQEGMSERREEEQAPPARPELAQPRPTLTTGYREPAETVKRESDHTLAAHNRGSDPTLVTGTRGRADIAATGNRPPAGDREADGGRLGAATTEAPPNERPALRAVPDSSPRRLQPAPEPVVTRMGAADPVAALRPAGRLRPMPDPKVSPRPAEPPNPPGTPDPARVADLLERRRRQQRLRRTAARRNRFVVVRDAADRDLWAARRRARADLPSPAAVTRDIALALLEVEAGCRSAAQLERIFSPQLWEALEHRIGRRGGPLPSGRSLISVRCQEDKPGLADTVAVVWRGDLVRPVALRLDACGGRWTVTELRWWRNETDTATSPGRDGGSS
jgi:uncharacterized protein DUF6459